MNKKLLINKIKKEMIYLKKFNNNKYETSFESMEYLISSYENRRDKLYKMYILTISNDDILMTMGCYVNKDKKYQCNNFIGKHFSNKKQEKNISILMHSYAAFLFNSENIIIKDSLEIMENILCTNNISTNNIFVLDEEEHNEEEFKHIHEEILNDSYENICKYVVLPNSRTLFIKVDDCLKELWKKSNLKFEYVKL